MKHSPSHVTSYTVLIIAGLMLAHGSAQAQTATSASPQRRERRADTPASQSNQPASSGLPSGGNTTASPWSIGVSPHQQKHAATLYQEGNRAFTNGFFAAAVTKYRFALQYWNHPGIHYNLALALISLDRPIEAYESITAALAHGADGLHPDEYQRATDYRHVLRRRIAEVEVVCDQPGAAVTLDGKPLFTGPGRVTTMVLPGQHQVVAIKTGYAVTIRTFELAAAGRARLELHLMGENHVAVRAAQSRGSAHALGQDAVPGRRLPAWMPWAVASAGLGTGAASVALHWQSIENARRHDGAPWQRHAAYIGYATTAAVLITGTVITYLHRQEMVEPRTFRDSTRISLHPGGPEGSPGVSIHVPF